MNLNDIFSNGSLHLPILTVAVSNAKMKTDIKTKQDRIKMIKVVIEKKTKQLLKIIVWRHMDADRCKYYD